MIAITFPVESFFTVPVFGARSYILISSASSRVDLNVSVFAIWSESLNLYRALIAAKFFLGG